MVENVQDVGFKKKDKTKMFQLERTFDLKSLVTEKGEKPQLPSWLLRFKQNCLKLKPVCLQTHCLNTKQRGERGRRSV